MQIVGLLSGTTSLAHSGYAGTTFATKHIMHRDIVGFVHRLYDVRYGWHWRCGLLPFRVGAGVFRVNDSRELLDELREEYIKQYICTT